MGGTGPQTAGYDLRLQASAERRGARGARSPGRAAQGAARWRCSQVPAAEAERWGPDAAAEQRRKKRSREL